MPSRPKTGRLALVKTIQEFLGKKAEVSAEERTEKVKAGQPWGHNFCTFNPKTKHCCAHRALLKPSLGHCRALPARCAVVENLQMPLQHHLLLSSPYSTLPSTPPTLQTLSNLQGASVWDTSLLGAPITGDEGARAEVSQTSGCCSELQAEVSP